MRTAEWARTLTSHPELTEFLTLEASAEWGSVASESRPILIAAAYLQHPRKMLIVTGSYERALHWQAKLQLCGISQDLICQLPSGTSALFEDATPEHIALSDRLGALRALTEPQPRIILTSPQAVLERTLPRDVLEEAFIEIAVGSELSPAKFLRHLVNLGYEPQEPVRIPGQFSRRGGIIDVYPTGNTQPVRIELFGDQIESMRVFDANTQRSVKSIQKLSFAPSRETLYYGEGDPMLGELVTSSAEREAASLGEEEAARLEELLAQDATALTQRVYFDRLDLYRPLLHPDSGCAIDLLSEEDILILDEPLELESLAARAEEELGEALQARAARGEILHSTALDFMLPPEQMASHALTIAITAMNAVPDWLSLGRRHDIMAISMEPYRGRPEALALTLKNYQSEGFTLIICSDQPNRAKSVLSQAEIFVSDDDADSSNKLVQLRQGNLGGGFVLPLAKTAVITDAELFGVARLKLPQRRFMEGAPVATVLDLKPGDFVVHIHFGIGIFRGLVKKTIEGIEKEFLYVEYQAPDKLFVPSDQLDRIQKYLNPGDDNPKLNKLTGGEWQRTISKAKEEAKAFARDLVKLYAQRHQVQRRSYGPDTPFQLEMEQTFPWVETPSQLQAIRDAKADLEMGYPMDRLVCGDVGFGKTEVAIRVAFKAVQAGRQVAILCPTTILSEQHYQNFKERLAGFGTRLEVVNRFTHALEKKQIVQDLKSGKVEIVVGTHSLLGTGIAFRDLGVVIIDEEQKFGVKQKEMLKQLRTEVDVLTLSATPIPRTLSMALMDIRQMSLINDPPPGRLPVRTFVRPYAGEVVREAILRELARGGQVFYVYNRVESIGHVAEKLRKLVPMARIGIGHGQMTEKELEPVMVGFIKGEIDVLLSTTIIENGIDISNANTLIVEQADRLGLSQLYQLRGRVGRSDRQAYAYFLYLGMMDSTLAPMTVRDANFQASGGKKRVSTVSDGAMARLQALQEFSTLGSGYSLAFRDLQIRGAGELLGAKQSGTMVNVGYELYTQLIQEAVAQLKNSVDGETGPDSDVKDPMAAIEALPAFDVPVRALLPEGYVKDPSQRLYYYQQIMSARDEIVLGAVEAEVEDRYGHPPKEVQALFRVMDLRIKSQRIGLGKVEAGQGRLSIQFKDRGTISPRVVSMLGKVNKNSYVTSQAWIWPFQGDPLDAIDNFLYQYAKAGEEIERTRSAFNH